MEIHEKKIYSCWKSTDNLNKAVKVKGRVGSKSLEITVQFSLTDVDSGK